MKYGDLEIYSVSMLGKFLSCNRAYAWRYSHLLTHERKSKALSFGSTIHDGIATWYKTKDLAKVVQSMETIGTELGLVPDLETDPKHSIERARGIMLKYIDRYAANDLNVTMVEVPFLLEVDADPEPFLFAGTIDGLAEQDGNLFVLENKTTTRMGTDYIKSYNPNNQISAYLWALSKYMDKPIHGAVLNIIHILTKETNFIRHTTRRQAWELEEFEVELKEMVRQIRTANERGVYVKNTNQCNVYGSCAYQTLCKTPKDYLSNFIEAEYITDTPGDLRWLFEPKGELVEKS